jgi:hypothetical protein
VQHLVNRIQIDGIASFASPNQALDLWRHLCAYGGVVFVLEPLGEPGNRRECGERLQSGEFSSEIFDDLLDQEFPNDTPRSPFWQFVIE